MSWDPNIQPTQAPSLCGKMNKEQQLKQLWAVNPGKDLVMHGSADGDGRGVTANLY